MFGHVTVLGLFDDKLLAMRVVVKCRDIGCDETASVKLLNDEIPPTRFDRVSSGS